MFATPFGQASVVVGTGHEQVITIASPHAATTVAALLSRIRFGDHETDLQQLRDDMVFDLTSAAVLSDPRCYSPTVHARLEGTAT